MSFVEQEDVLNTLENLVKHLFKQVKNIEFGNFPRISYSDAMKYYGSDKPDIRFDMKFVYLTELVKNKGFKIFDEAEVVVGINAPNCSEYTRKQIDELTEFVRKPQIGASGLIYVKYNNDLSIKSSVDKFYSAEELQGWIKLFDAKPGDMLLILSGNTDKTLKALSELRLEMGSRLGLRNPNNYAPLWVVDFPLLEWDEETQRFYAKHHPFTSPKTEDYELIETNPAQIRANAYDLVINGVEVGGGSIRIFNKELQRKMFALLGFTDEEALNQFGFLMNAFEYGAPPHGGIAFGFDRLCSLFGGSESIRDFIAFPKNNAGRDVMSDSPSPINETQPNELKIKIVD
jgi:aspartyl-tRNA synthetase